MLELPTFATTQLGRHSKPEIEPIFELDCTFAWIGGGGESEYIGLDGLREGWLDLVEAWKSVRSEFERVIPVGERVLVLARRYARIVGSQHEVETIGAAIYLVRDGKIARAESTQLATRPSKPWGSGVGDVACGTETRRAPLEDAPFVPPTPSYRRVTPDGWSRAGGV